MTEPTEPDGPDKAGSAGNRDGAGDPPSSTPGPRAYSGYGVPVAGGNEPPSVLEAGRISPETRRRRRRLMIGGAALALVVLIVALVWFLQTPLGVVSRAVAATFEQGSARTRVSGTLGDLPLLGDVELVVAEGEVEFDSGEARLRREIFGGVATELRYVDDGVYLEIPLTDGRWVRLAESPPSGDGITDVTSVAPGLGNPIALVGLLRTLESTPREVGDDEVAGVPVTVYEVVVDLDEAADLLGEEVGDLIVRLRRLTGDGELPLEVAIDDDTLIRRVRFSTDVPLSRLFSPRLDNSIEFSDFGVPVDVAPPPDEQIVSVDPSTLDNLDPLGALRDLLDDLPVLN